MDIPIELLELVLVCTDMIYIDNMVIFTFHTWMSDAVEQALSNGAKIIDFHFIYLKNGCNDAGCNAKVQPVSWVQLAAS